MVNRKIPYSSKNLMLILLPLLTAQTTKDMAIYLAEFLAGHQLTTIQCLTGKAT